MRNSAIVIASPVILPSAATLVSTKVGHNTVTASSLPDSSAAMVSDKASTPAFPTLYAAIPGAAEKAAAEATLISPPCPDSRSCGRKSSEP